MSGPFAAAILAWSCAADLLGLPPPPSWEAVQFWAKVALAAASIPARQQELDRLSRQLRKELEEGEKLLQLIRHGQEREAAAAAAGPWVMADRGTENR